VPGQAPCIGSLPGAWNEPRAGTEWHMLVTCLSAPLPKQAQEKSRLISKLEIFRHLLVICWPMPIPPRLAWTRRRNSLLRAS